VMMMRHCCRKKNKSASKHVRTQNCVNQWNNSFKSPNSVLSILYLSTLSIHDALLNRYNDCKLPSS
jgi:hypothetical protein